MSLKKCILTLVKKLMYYEKLQEKRFLTCILRECEFKMTFWGSDVFKGQSTTKLNLHFLNPCQSCTILFTLSPMPPHNRLKDIFYDQPSVWISDWNRKNIYIRSSVTRWLPIFNKNFMSLEYTQSGSMYRWWRTCSATWARRSRGTWPSSTPPVTPSSRSNQTQTSWCPSGQPGQTFEQNHSL